MLSLTLPVANDRAGCLPKHHFSSQLLVVLPLQAWLGFEVAGSGVAPSILLLQVFVHHRQWVQDLQLTPPGMPPSVLLTAIRA